MPNTPTPMLDSARDDAALVRQARQGDRPAFDLLVRRHAALVRGVVRRLGLSVDDLDDLAQETFISAFVHLDQLARDEQFAPWLVAIARRTGLMWQRRQYAQPVLLPLGDAEPANASDQANREPLAELVAEALAKLTAAQRQAVRLHYFAGYDYRETAALVRAPEGAVRGRLDRARTILRRELVAMTAVPSTGLMLTPRDLQAWAHAAGFAAAADQHPALNAVLLTGGGELVATDTHRIYVYTSPTLAQVPRLLTHADAARLLRDEAPPSSRAELARTQGQWELRLAPDRSLPLSLLSDEYPHWERCLPQDALAGATAPCGDWRCELEAVTKAWESDLLGQRGPDEQARVVIALEPAEGLISLTICRRPVSPAPATHEFTVAFAADFMADSVPIRLGANLHYVSQAVAALMVDEATPVQLRASGARHPFVLQAMPAGDTYVVTMPMLLSDEPPETP